MAPDARGSWPHRSLGWLMPGADAPRIQDAAVVDHQYRRLRRQIMVTLIVTYGFLYTCRLGLSIVKKPLIDAGIFDAVELGWIGAGFLWGYGAGKLLNGFIADRVNVRMFYPTGLAISAIINVAMGSNTMVVVAIVLWCLNGWFQGIGAPASVVSITQWFARREHGTMYGIWSTAHAIGEAVTFIGIAALAAATVWRAAFWAPGLMCIGMAVAALVLLRDRPPTVGLPPVEAWRAERNQHRTGPEPAPDDDHDASDSGTSGGWLDLLRLQLSLLKMPSIWIIGLASLSMYVTRYAINSWGILFLQESHGLSTELAGLLVGINTIVGILGCMAYGFISDRWFASRRPPLTLIFGVLEIVGLCLVLHAPRGNTALIGVGMVIYGFTLSGLLAVLGGLFAVDIAPRRATGAAMGVIGVFSYLGAGVQDLVSGMLIERGSTVVDGVRVYDFSAASAVWVAASVVSMGLAASLWRVRARDGDRASASR